MLVKGPGDDGWHEPAISTWTAETALRDLLTSSPHLIPGLRDAVPVAAEELWIPPIGSADVVAVTSAGQIVIVECKLRDNPEIRRHVVGQLFAYASGLWQMTYEEFDGLVAARIGGTIEQSLREEAGADWDEEGFRAAVTSNLRDGRFTLVFAVDAITDELKTIVEYLNGHTIPDVEVLALELQHVQDGAFEVLVPHIYGAESASMKRGASRSRIGWNE